MSPEARVYVISAPSGGGKTSLVTALRQRVDGLAVSVSSTTRPMREGERDGVDYHFLSQDAFQQQLAAGRFIEYAEVFGNYYGTSATTVHEQLQQGLDVILVIDWQGAQQARTAFSDISTIFVLPPSLAELERRLRERATDGDDVIQRRLAEARGEISHVDEYDYVVVNDDFDTAVAELAAIITAQRRGAPLAAKHHAPLVAQLLA